MQDWKDALGALRDSGAFPPSDNSENTAIPDEAGVKEGGEQKPSKLPKVNFFFEKKGRAGKQATILTGFSPAMNDSEIEDLGRKLKQRLGCGGSVRGGEILLQGDVRQQARLLLSDWGFKF
ncbi:MAG: translation initiation factor [Muribaculaceae bacterium]|nr:translation initiation factor [Muribaculaceae bacterium]